jgi:hypothetical protein
LLQASQQIGLDVALEALKDARAHRKASVDDIWRYAKICRVANGEPWMSPANPNVAASVRARLLNVAKTQGVDFQQVLVRFSVEHRLIQSKHADRFLLEGALLFTLWSDMPRRATPTCSASARATPPQSPKCSAT